MDLSTMPNLQARRSRVGKSQNICILSQPATMLMGIPDPSSLQSSASSAPGASKRAHRRCSVAHTLIECLQPIYFNRMFAALYTIVP
jgi:hypothetical protein